MNSLQWIELHDAFQKFAAVARKFRFFLPTLEKMEEALYEMCPMPHSWRAQCRGGSK